MPRKIINYDEWLRTRTVAEGRTKRILAFFDLAKLKRKSRRADESTRRRTSKQRG